MTSQLVNVETVTS